MEENQTFTATFNNEHLGNIFFEVVENSWNEVVLIDPETFRYKYLNKKILENIGYSAEELLGQEITIITPEFSLSRAKEFVKPLINGEKTQLIYETKRKRKDGSIYPIRVNLRYLKNSDEPVLVAINRDISGQKELESNKNLLVELLDNSLNEICIFEAETLEIIYANNRGLSNLGYSREELLGKTPCIMDPGLTQKKALEIVRPLIEGKSKFIEFNTRHIRKDGTIYPVEVLLQAGKFDNKKVLFSIVKDITEYQNAENLNYSLAQVLENSWNEIFIVDEKTLKTVYANKTALNNLGYTLKEIKKLTVADINRNFVLEEFLKVFDSQSDKSELIFETTHTRKDETTYENEIRIQKIIFNNRSCFLAIANNVTQQKQLHNLMVQNEKMMSVGNLAAGIAHEINNPLSAILHSIQNINRRVSYEFERNNEAADSCNTNLKDINCFLEKQKISHLFSSIENSAIRAAKITNDLLGFARQSDEKYNLKDITEVIDNAIGLAKNDYNLKEQYDFKKVEIMRLYKKNLPKIHCISSELEQVFLNLLINSTHAMKDYCENPTVTIQAYKDMGNVFVTLSDNGPGIKENIKKKIFDPFFTTKETGKGTGLGLAVSYFIVKKRHKGEIFLDTNYDDGAKFVIQFPISST